MERHLTLSESQARSLESALHLSATSASKALTTWIGRDSSMKLESVDQLMLSEVTGLLDTEGAVFCGSMTLPKDFPGQLMVVFDQASGLALADMILAQPIGTSTEWGEMQDSAALESTNILCCAYLNTLVAELFEDGAEIKELIPEPPVFRQEFAESLLEFALMSQATDSNEVFLVRTILQTSDDASLNWTLLWVPEAAALKVLPQIIKET